MESSDGTQRIAPREIFEDVYVTMGPAVEKWPLLNRRNFSHFRSETPDLGPSRDAGVSGTGNLGCDLQATEKSNNGKSEVARLHRAT